MKVSIRKTPLAKNMIGLSLDIYDKGVSKYKNLGIKLFAQPSSKQEKEHNKRSSLLAESIRSKLFLDLQEGKYNIYTGSKAEACFIQYFERLTKERRNSESNYGNWSSVLKHLKEFSKGRHTRFLDIDERFLLEFKKYLQEEGISKGGEKLSQNSASSYFNKVKAALNQALNEKIINDNPSRRVKSIKPGDTRREFLLEEELKLLIKTECTLPILKRAFLFSCLTGLRWSDIQKLVWREVVYSEVEKRWKIHFTQKKTKGVEYHPISEEAYKLLGQRKELTDKIFKGLRYSAWNNHLLQEWIRSAGISKKITFHAARHTYACLLLSSGGDIYTISSLLGHRDLKTTQIYAKIIDTTKNRVVDLLPSIGI